MFNNIAGCYTIRYHEWEDKIQLLNNADPDPPLDTVDELNIDNSQWRAFKVEFDKGIFNIYLDDVLKLTYDDSANYQDRTTGNLFGFDATTGGATNIHRVRNMKWIPRDIGLDLDGIYNPTVEFIESGTYIIFLKVQSQYEKQSPLAKTTITVIDGKIEGQVKAADLRTPVKGVTIKLTSPHVDTHALARVATNSATINTTADDGLVTTTDDEGNYSFPNLPLGSYKLVASKVDGETIHEFETRKQVTEITLDTPNQPAIDYVDLSVYPVGGQIYYSIFKGEGANAKKVLVEDVTVVAQAIGSTSDIEALDSTKSRDAKNQNYSMPLFTGRYLFKAKRGGHEIRLVGTKPSNGKASGTTPSGYDATSQLVTIEESRTDIDFVDYTTRTITVIVEDSGGFPIETYQDNTIEVSIIGINGQKKGPVEEGGQTTFTAEVPPGEYTISLPNVPTAIVKDKKGQKEAEVDATAGDGEVTMVVPVLIELEITPPPKLLNVPNEFLEKIGLTAEDNPEGFMIYFEPEKQKHTYTIKATANEKVVKYMVLHDPPGDASYSYLEDTMTAKGVVTGMKIKLKDRDIPVYPSPWSVERTIVDDNIDVDFDNIKEEDKDLGKQGLLGNRDSISSGGVFAIAATVELAVGSTVVLIGPAAYALQVAKFPVAAGLLGTEAFVQYEVSSSRSLETAIEDEISKAIPDVMGPGKGDIYFGEGWTVGLQTKYRLGIKKDPNDLTKWIPDTALILTFDILNRDNQYVYTVREIEELIANLQKLIDNLGNPADGTPEKKELEKRQNTQGT